MDRTFDELVDEAAAVPVDGWDFNWLYGRATEERPSWHYQQLMAARLATVDSALDIQTGGGEVLAGAATFPPCMVATESWPANVAKATALLHPRGAVVVADKDEPPLPFAAEAFALVTSRHPVAVAWDDVARVLKPGGTYLSQQVGPESAFELIEFFCGPATAAARRARHPDDARTGAEQAGLQVSDLRFERLRMEFFDVGAVVYILRKVIWWVPGFTVEAYRDRLLLLDEQIRTNGSFVAHSSRFLIEAHKPGGSAP